MLSKHSQTNLLSNRVFLFHICIKVIDHFSTGKKGNFDGHVSLETGLKYNASFTKTLINVHIYTQKKWFLLTSTAITTRIEPFHILINLSITKWWKNLKNYWNHGIFSKNMLLSKRYSITKRARPLLSVNDWLIYSFKKQPL